MNIPKTDPGSQIDKQSRTKLLEMWVEQKIAKCERAIARPEIDDPSKEVIRRFLTDLNEIHAMMLDYNKSGIGKIWRRPKALGKLAKKITKLKENYNLVDATVLDKIDKDVE